MNHDPVEELRRTRPAPPTGWADSLRGRLVLEQVEQRARETTVRRSRLLTLGAAAATVTAIVAGGVASYAGAYLGTRTAPPAVPSPSPSRTGPLVENLRCVEKLDGRNEDPSGGTHLFHESPTVARALEFCMSGWLYRADTQGFSAPPRAVVCRIRDESQQPQPFLAVFADYQEIGVQRVCARVKGEPLPGQDPKGTPLTPAPQPSASTPASGNG